MEMRGVFEMRKTIVILLALVISLSVSGCVSQRKTVPNPAKIQMPTSTVITTQETDREIFSFLGEWIQTSAIVNGLEQQVTVGFSLIFESEDLGIYYFGLETGDFIIKSSSSADYKIIFDPNDPLYSSFALMNIISPSKIELIFEAGSYILKKQSEATEQTVNSEPSGGVNKTTFEKVKEGMTYREVEKIFGRDGNMSGESGTSGNSMKTYVWSGDNGGTVTITFYNDAMVVKSQNLKNENSNNSSTALSEDSLIQDNGGEDVNWPDNILPEDIPEFEGGVIITVMEMANGCFISLEKISQSAFEDYIEMLKIEGWNILMELEEGGTRSVMLSRNDEMLQLAFSDEGSVDFSYGKQ